MSVYEENVLAESDVLKMARLHLKNPLWILWKVLNRKIIITYFELDEK